MQITLTIPDKKADSFWDVLRHISYVEIQPSNDCHALPSADKDEELSAEEFYDGLKEAIHDVNEAIAGRKQLRTAEEFLAELRG
jgi:hypothetical protein